jgi:hypothetical protein
MATDRHTLALWISSVCCVVVFALAGYVLLFVILPDALHFFQDCRREGLASVDGKLTDEERDRITARCNRAYFTRAMH